MSIVSDLFRVARIAATADAMLSDQPERKRRRIKNILVGRALARVGFWRWLWR